MKIIKKGLFDKDGIFMSCHYCNAQFLIENKADFSTKIDYDLYKRQYFVNYSVDCPCCKALIWLGYIDDEEFMGQYGCLRERNDWVERYKVIKENETMEEKI